MILRLLLRVGLAAQRVRGSAASASTRMTFTPRFCAKIFMTCVAFVQAQQAVIDEHADQLVADGLVQQRRDHRGIHAAGKAQQHLALAHLRAHARDGVFDDVADAPQRLAAADLAHEALEQLLALQRVRDFGMELHGVEARAISSAMAASGALALCATAVKPGGSDSTWSPWLIHTSSTPRPCASWRSNTPSNSLMARCAVTSA